MPEPQIKNEPLMRLSATADLITALDLLLRKAGDCLDKDQRIEVLSVIIAVGCALQRARVNGQ